MLKGLTKEKEENQTMNNKMAKDTYLLIESKKQTKQARRTQTESWIWRVF